MINAVNVMSQIYNKHIAKVLYELVNFTMDHCPIFFA